MSRTSKAVPDSLITDELVNLQTRIGLGFVYLQTHAKHPTPFIKGKVRLTGLVVRDYLPALRAMLAHSGRDAVTAQLEVVTGRLEKGAELLGAPATTKIDDGYIRLLAEYEILTDALQVEHFPDSYLNRFFDRVNGIEKQTPERIAIVGSRGYSDLELVRAYVAALPSETFVAVAEHDGIGGLVIRERCSQGLEVGEFFPDPALGEKRFMARYEHLLMYVSRVVAFWDGRQTSLKRFIDQANAEQRSVEVYLPSGTAVGR